MDNKKILENIDHIFDKLIVDLEEKYNKSQEVFDDERSDGYVQKICIGEMNAYTYSMRKIMKYRKDLLEMISEGNASDILIITKYDPAIKWEINMNIECEYDNEFCEYYINEFKEEN